MEDSSNKHEGEVRNIRDGGELVYQSLAVSFER
jgi:hypothetical protein